VTEQQDKRKAGIAKMEDVYSFSVDPDTLPGRYAALTVDHLFGTVWTDDTLALRDRRLMTIGVLATLDKTDLLEIQFDVALERDELTPEQVREIVVHLTYYIGWPLSTNLNAVAEKVIRRRAKAATGEAEA
jgi:4-carboxymuconolactone decarboxylase